MTNRILFSAIVSLLVGFHAVNAQKATDQASVVDFVDPVIGAEYHVHTFPGATVPFGMVKLSPDNDVTGWDWCSGYHYSDSSIMGFSHNHLSETGWADLGDILLMPTTGKIRMEPGSKANPDEGYRSRFSYKREKAQNWFDNLRKTMYSTAPVVMINNEDCGQMSAWYIMSALGFYPVCPGKPVYDLGTPLFPEASIHLENGNTFKIIAHNVSDKNIYVQNIKLNGNPFSGLLLNHEDIME